MEPRDAARLLVDRGPGQPPAHHVVADLPDLLRPGDVVVVNDTRVLPARRLKPGERLAAAAGHQIELVSPVPDGAREGHKSVSGVGRRAAEIPVTRRVRLLDGDGRPAPDEATELAWLSAIGEVPLPPY